MYLGSDGRPSFLEKNAFRNCVAGIAVIDGIFLDDIFFGSSIGGVCGDGDCVTDVRSFF